jgi:hypothetical protein
MQNTNHGTGTDADKRMRIQAQQAITMNRVGVIQAQ